MRARSSLSSTGQEIAPGMWSSAKLGGRARVEDRVAILQEAAAAGTLMREAGLMGVILRLASKHLAQHPPKRGALRRGANSVRVPPLPASEIGSFPVGNILPDQSGQRFLVEQREKAGVVAPSMPRLPDTREASTACRCARLADDVGAALLTELTTSTWLAARSSRAPANACGRRASDSAVRAHQCQCL